MDVLSRAIVRSSPSALPSPVIAPRGSSLIGSVLAAPSRSPSRLRLRDSRLFFSGSLLPLLSPYSRPFTSDCAISRSCRGSGGISCAVRCVRNSAGGSGQGENRRAGDKLPLARRGAGHAEAAAAAGARRGVLARSYRWSDDDVAAFGGGVEGKFEEAVALFNEGQFYKCHDVLEEMWHQSAEPQRSMLHGLLQCAVGMVHLLNQNHSGAMMEFGEGVNKLRRAIAATGGGGPSGSFGAFEREAGAVLEFIYSTQLEHAACSERECVTMDGSPESYSLLGDYGAGQPLYRLHVDRATGQQCIEFCALLPFHQAVVGDGAGSGSESGSESESEGGARVTRVSVPLPRLTATEEELVNLAW
ncbi:hypothetical protein CLOM_g6403 [Closterium sp. NIES-68]|nr:hypothetical protein CLOM_g6403 [Closterium sp. NIES-68]GJP68549.1 hypothetical protein CLOP_g25237 [Closterium sp. NIES-67]